MWCNVWLAFLDHLPSLLLFSPESFQRCHISLRSCRLLFRQGCCYMPLWPCAFGLIKALVILNCTVFSCVINQKCMELLVYILLSCLGSSETLSIKCATFSKYLRVLSLCVYVMPRFHRNRIMSHWQRSIWIRGLWPGCWNCFKKISWLVSIVIALH